MALNDPGTYVDSPGGKIRAVVPFYWNGSAYVASSGGNRRLYITGAVVGNTAVTSTDETLQSYSLPARTLVNVGDSIRIVAGGSFGATTDSKTLKLKFDGVALITQVVAQSANTRWWLESTIVKTGSSTQSHASVSVTLNAITSGTNAGNTSRTDTNQLPILITGANATNAVANSLTCQFMSVEFMPAP